MHKLFIIIPAFNESRSIGKIIRTIYRYVIGGDVIVVDDGSVDNTGIIANNNSAHVIKLPQNFGTARATQVGLIYALKQKADKVVLMDADGQHDPKYIPLLLKELDNGADLVVASRYVEKTDHVTSPIRRYGTKIIALLISATYKVKITDPTSGFRAMNRKTLEYVADNYPTAFPEPEVILDLVKKGFVTREIPVQMKPRMYGKSSISLKKALYLMGYIILKIINEKVS